MCVTVSLSVSGVSNVLVSLLAVAGPDRDYSTVAHTTYSMATGSCLQAACHKMTPTAYYFAVLGCTECINQL